jgi:hypothetical protein
LTIVQQASLRVLKISPSVAVSSTDANVLQLVALVNEEGQELSSRYSWQILTAEATFTTVATAIQGVITTLAGAGFNFFVNQTMWNRSQRRPLYGPLTPQQWQEWQAAFSSGPWISYRLRQNNLLFFPFAHRWAIRLLRMGHQILGDQQHRPCERRLDDSRHRCVAAG